MTDTNPLPPLPEPEGVIVVGTQALRAFTAYQMRTYALQARAQVQGEQFGYIHHFVAHDEHGALIDTTWEADGCADALPHPTQPAAWKWSHATPFYTTPHPAQATQAEVTDAEIDAVTRQQWGEQLGVMFQAHRAYARAILALRPVQVNALAGCNCRWDGDNQVEWCELHLAHKEAIHEWAERAKSAEQKLALRPVQVPMTDEQISLEAHNADDRDWNDLRFRSSWHEGFLEGARFAEAHHGITAQAEKETP